MRLGVTRLLVGLQTKELNGTVFISFPFQIFQIFNVNRILLLCTGYSHGYHGELDMVVIPDYEQDLPGVMPIFLSLSPSKTKCFSSPPALFIEAASVFLLFIVGNVLWQ